MQAEEWSPKRQSLSSYGERVLWEESNRHRRTSHNHNEHHLCGDCRCVPSIIFCWGYFPHTPITCSVTSISSVVSRLIKYPSFSLHPTLTPPYPCTAISQGVHCFFLVTLTQRSNLLSLDKCCFLYSAGVILSTAVCVITRPFVLSYNTCNKVTTQAKIELTSAGGFNILHPLQLMVLTSSSPGDSYPILGGI